MTKETERNAPWLPVAMLKCLSEEIYTQYFAMVSGLIPEVREDFIMSIIVTAIILYDPNRPGLTDIERIHQEQEIFYSILVKYCVLKFGVHGMKSKLEGLSIKERVDRRVLVYLKKMKAIFEQTVILTDGGEILQAVKRLAIEDPKH